ncbi:MAG TPA: hypothetical protein VNJ04_04985 [Gemmatimonadaceae bacterium]|nr:hypothetical protein [Gemmatimonadaceae bacterium]
MQPPPPATTDAILWDFLGAELDAAALPLPPLTPAFAAETVRPSRPS